MPTTGALAPATALAPTAVVPKGTTELTGGAAAAAGDPGPEKPRQASATRGTSAARPRQAVRIRARRGHPVYSFTASMSWRRRAKWKRSKRSASRGSSG